MAILANLRSWVSRSRRASEPKPKSRARAQLRIEPLETRELLNGVSPFARRVQKQSPNAYAIKEMYNDILLRGPSLAELAAWDSVLKGGLSRAQMAAAFIGSPEFRGNLVRNEYRLVLNRDVDASGLGGWTNALGSGLSVEQFSSLLFGSDEYFQSQGRDQARWLDSLYREVLGRAIDAPGQAAWLNVLSTGIPASSVAMAIIRSPEHLTRVVHNTYDQLLRRQADPLGTQHWVAAMQRGMTMTQFMAAVAGSQEYGNISGNTAGVNGRGQIGGIGREGILGGDGEFIGGGGEGGGFDGGTFLRDGGGGGSGGGGSGGGGWRGGGSGSGGIRPLAADKNASNIPASDYAEMAIAVNPTNPNNIVIASAIVNDLPMLAFYTFDGGETWTRVVLDAGVDGFGGFTVNRSDPHVVFDASGRLYLSYLLDTTAIDTPAGVTALIVLRSTDGGRTYAGSYVIRESNANGTILNDKELLAVGPAPGNPNQQNVYLAWVRFTNLGLAGQQSVIFISGSTDGGVTWSPPTPVSDANVANTHRATPGVGPNGEVYVSFWAAASTFGGAAVFFDSSLTFDGTSFNFGIDRRVVTLSHQVFLTGVPAQPTRLVGSIPVMAVDRSAGPTRGWIHIVAADFPGPGASPNFNIYMMTSSDQGNTWSAPRRVDDDISANAQFNPWVFVDPTNGCVSASWRDARNDGANRRVDIFSATSGNGGVTFSPNVQVSDASSDVSAGTEPNNYLEYDGLAAFNGKLYFAWSDNSANPNGNKAIFFDTIDSGCTGSVIGPPGGGQPPLTPPLPGDVFEPNDTSDQASNLPALAGTISGLTIGRKNGLPDYDWYQARATASGRVSVTINYTSPEGGDLHIRLFVRSAAGTLTEIGSSRNIGTTTQTATANVAAGSLVLIWVYGFNNVQGNYDLSIGLS